MWFVIVLFLRIEHYVPWNKLSAHRSFINREGLEKAQTQSRLVHFFGAVGHRAEMGIEGKQLLGLSEINEHLQISALCVRVMAEGTPL